jgi:two-component system response regulator MprA
MVKIVLADDHALVRNGLVKILKSHGYENVVAAENGRQAVDLCASENPDIVFLDIQMPELDGLEACREIRATRPEVKIVIMTMHEADDVRQNAVEAGADDYLLKSEAPVKLAALVEKLS